MLDYQRSCCGLYRWDFVRRPARLHHYGTRVRTGTAALRFWLIMVWIAEKASSRRSLESVQPLVLRGGRWRLACGVRWRHLDPFPRADSPPLARPERLRRRLQTPAKRCSLACNRLHVSVTDWSVTTATPVRTAMVRHVAIGEVRHILQPDVTHVVCFDARRALLRLVLSASLFSRSRQTQLVSIELSQQARRPTCSLLRVFRLAVRHTRVTHTG